MVSRLETAKFMKKAMTASVSLLDETIKELRADKQFAVEYLKAALEELDDPNNRAAGLLAWRDVAEPEGVLGVVAAQAGISQEALSQPAPTRWTVDMWFCKPGDTAKVGIGQCRLWEVTSR